MVYEYEHPHGVIFDFLGRTEEDYRCYSLIKKLRWPNGFVCPKCKGKEHYRLKNDRIQCAATHCRYQASFTARTAFHGSKVSIRKWFMAILYMGNNQGGVSAEGLKKLIHVSTKTARRMLTRLREVMQNANEKRFMNALFYGIKELIRPKKLVAAKAAIFVQEEPSGVMKVSFCDPSLLRDVPISRQAPKNNPRTALVVASAITHLTRFFMGTYHRFCLLNFPLYLAEFVYRFNEPNPEVILLRLLTDCVTTFERP